MIIFLIVKVFIKAFLLFILIYIVARDGAGFQFRKATMVAAGIVLGAVILDAALTRWIGLFTIIPIAVFTVFMTRQFCRVRFWRSLLVVIPFLMLNAMIPTAVTSSHHKQGGTNAFPFPMERKTLRTEKSLEHILFKTLMAWFTSTRAAGDGKTKFFMPDGMQAKDRINTGMDSKLPRVNENEKSAGSEEDKTQPTATDLNWQEAGNKINVKGTLTGRDGVRVAIVNNQMVREGECIQVEHKKTVYRWRARLIREGGISWEPVEAFPR